MKIAFVANPYLDPATTRSWSGLPYFVRRALCNSGLKVENVVLEDSYSAWTHFRFAYYKYIRSCRYIRACDRLVLKSYGRQLDDRLRHMEVDAVFSLSSWLVAYARSQIPMVFWTDACFASMLGFYPSFSQLAAPSVRHGHEAEQAALEKCAAAIYPSQWAATAARAHYHFDHRKLRVIPFGGNLLERPSRAGVQALVDLRSSSACELILVGVDWLRKGVDKAIATARALNEAGVPAHLTIVGCAPPRGQVLPEWVSVIPFIAKDTSEGRAHLNRLFGRSHFLIMPSIAEAYGLVFAEASAFGVPSLATDVGGISSIISNGVNGQLFRPTATPEEFAHYIQNIMKQPARYRELAMRSAEEAALRLNWESAGPAVAQILEDIISPSETITSSIPRHAPVWA